jgi:hypothetical protein
MPGGKAVAKAAMAAKARRLEGWKARRLEEGRR